MFKSKINEFNRYLYLLIIEHYKIRPNIFCVCDSKTAIEFGIVTQFQNAH